MVSASPVWVKKLVALLLDHRAFVGTIQAIYQPVAPLHVAARLGSDAICRLILERGANVNARDIMEQTPLHKAVTNGHLLVAPLLIVAGADIDARDILQRTALHYAASMDWFLLVKLLLDHGANPDVVDKGGISPRQAAVRASGHVVLDVFDEALRRRERTSRLPIRTVPLGRGTGYGPPALVSLMAAPQSTRRAEESKYEVC